MTTIDLLKKTKAAWGSIRSANAEEKNRLLLAMAESLEANQADILRENQKDMDAARGSISDVMLDRLALTQARIHAMSDGIREAAELPDHVGRALAQFTRPNGMTITKRQVPLGLVAIIYESRPNVTSDAAALCIKSGNVCMLRSGKEAHRSACAIVKALKSGIAQGGGDPEILNIVDDITHQSATDIMTAKGLVDLLIPRGGAGLIRAVAKEASVPVIRTGEGVCHIYIDDEADLDMGASILFNAKCSRPSVCNAVECVLVHRDVAADFWKKALPLLDEKGVELRADPEALEILGTRAVPAEDSDWDAEYDDYILAVKTAGGMDEAIDFINAHGTQHSEAIITKNYFKAQHFLDHVDAAAVYVNASTRFTDGGEFGLGAEIGISTQKMHARGPMGLEELTSCKYVIYGEGQVR